MVPSDGSDDVLRKAPHCEKKCPDRCVVAAEECLFEAPTGAIVLDGTSHDVCVIVAFVFEQHEFSEVMQKRETAQRLYLFYAHIELSHLQSTLAGIDGMF